MNLPRYSISTCTDRLSTIDPSMKAISASIIVIFLPTLFAIVPATKEVMAALKKAKLTNLYI